MIPRLLVSAAIGGFGLIVGFLPSAGATEMACVSGHNMTVPPCTFDNGVLSLDSASSTELGQGGGHNTQVIFSGTSITIEANVAGGFPSYNSNDSNTGTTNGTILIKISTLSGLPLIDDISFALIDPATSGTGSIAWSLGSVSGDQSKTSGDLIFATPQSSITETLSVTLNSGIDGDATVNGGTLDVSLVPEPSSIALFGATLIAFAVVCFHRRSV